MRTTFSQFHSSLRPAAGRGSAPRPAAERCTPVLRARLPPRAKCCFCSSLLRLLVDDVEKELLNTGVAGLTEPEDCFLAEVRILVVLRAVEKLVHRCRSVAALRQDEDHLLLHLLIGDFRVKRDDLVDSDTTLSGPEQRFLAELDVLAVVDSESHQPLLVALTFPLSQREENLLLELVV